MDSTGQYFIFKTFDKFSFYFRKDLVIAFNFNAYIKNAL